MKEQIALARFYAEGMSDDIHTQTACMVRIDDFWFPYTNEMPPGVEVTEERQERPTKYAYISHAEENAIASLAREGIPTEGAEMVLTWFPCPTCARLIVTAGFAKLYAVEPDWNTPKGKYDFDAALAILTEGGVDIEWVAPEVTH